LDSTKNANKGGTGLGLVISNKLAKRLGNKDKKGIEVKSEVGVGSNFFFSIEDKEYTTIIKNLEGRALEPLVNEYHQRNSDLKRIKIEKPEKLEITCDCPKILIVDDNEHNVYALNILCEINGYMKSFKSNNGQDVLD
jgi:hypothetical protein